ncbi:hypothetical protein H708_00939 [Bartonella bacilliformis VAB9028]|nr:hypothetical protein H708_00939 [Bartonella bacilliformis VAB9028]
MFNKVILIGYLGADPESRRMASGAEVVNFRIATSQSYTDKTTNQRVDKTEWHSVVIFNPHLAKIALQYLIHKGWAFFMGRRHMRKISKEGLALIKQWEGLRLCAYQDAIGV